MSDLDLQDDDAVLRERLGRLASSAAQSVPPAPAPDGIRRRGTARRQRRTAAGVVSAGLAVLAVGGVVSGTSVLRGAPVEPAAPTPSVSATSSPSPTTSPAPRPSSTATTPTRTRTVTVTQSASAVAVPAPTAQVQQPWARDGAEFGVLAAVRSTADGVVVTYTPRSYDPDGGSWGPPQPRRTVTVPARAYFSGSSVLAPDAALPAEGVRLTAAQFTGAARSAVSGGALVGVWFFHATSDLASPVTGVQEQYRP